MLDKALWKLFESTGRIEVYLIYKGLWYIEKSIVDKDSDIPEQSQRNTI